jgi:hypothetical protein
MVRTMAALWDTLKYHLRDKQWDLVHAAIEENRSALKTAREELRWGSPEKDPLSPSSLESIDSTTP